MTDAATKITAIVLELHPKSGDRWSRAKCRLEDGTTSWVVAKWKLSLGETLVAEATYNAKFRSYDLVRLVDEGGTVSNGVVILKLVERLSGVGVVKARRLGEKFPDLFEAIQSSPEAVAAACGAKLEDVKDVAESLAAERGNLSRVTKLVDLGYPNHLAKQIACNEQAYPVATTSPYAAIRLVSGLGWLLADQVGRKMGIAKDDPARIAAGIGHYYADSVAGDGHTRVHEAALLAPEALPAMLGVPRGLIQHGLDSELIPLGGGWYTSARHRDNAETIAGFFFGG
jgi:hypothetical protein